jgi:hypothetical protein
MHQHQEPDRAPTPAPRADLYRTPHRTLRYLLANLLVAFGRTSFDDPADVETVLSELAAVLAACDAHVAHEDQHVRPVLLERAPSTLVAIDGEHADHARHVEELRALAASLRAAQTSDDKNDVGRTLYLHYSVFVAETLAHAAYEERVVQPLLERFVSAEELEKIHRAILASIPPPEMLRWARSMIPASDRATRAAFVQQIRSNAPPAAFAALMSDLRGVLSAPDLVDLQRRCG